MPIMTTLPSTGSLPVNRTRLTVVEPALFE
jgi:hypothetical protein